jgi:N-methylhydantoinase B
MTVLHEAIPGVGGLPGTRTRAVFRPRTDLVTFEVLRHRLWQINVEYAQTLHLVSGSPVASEGSDFNTTIADSEGNLIGVGPYVQVHLSSLQLMFEHALKILGPERIHDGDMYLVNDPWCGAVHQNDAGVIAPVFRDGQQIAWVGSVVHQVDVGGTQKGSWNPFAYDVFDEAPRYRFLRVVSGSEPQPEVISTYVTNSRLPHQLELDLRAQIAGANVAVTRLNEILDRYGAPVVSDVMQDLMDYSEVRLREKLRKIPDGTWCADDYLEHDGHREHIYGIRVSVEKHGDELTVDFRETDPQSDGFVNCTYSSLLGFVFASVLGCLCQDIPGNSGVLRPIKILTNEGTINNATYPAPVSSGVVNAGTVTENVVAAALAKMQSCSDEFRQDAMAVWSGGSLRSNIFGKNQDGRTFGTHLQGSLGGAGARGFADGYSYSGSFTTPRPTHTNVESVEEMFPLLYMYRRNSPDSGGAGLYRGGIAVDEAFTVHGVDKVDVTVNMRGVNQSSGVGIVGGYPGSCYSVELIEHANPLGLLQDHRLPDDLAQLDGEHRFLPAKCQIVLNKGDLYVSRGSGGGGYGDPLRRDPLIVARDVRHGLVSARQVHDLYGVVLDEHWKPDLIATDELRQRIRQARRGNAVPEPSLPKDDSVPLVWLGPGLYVTNGAVVCDSCKSPLGPSVENPKLGMVRSEFRLDRAGPWMATAFGGDSPDFKLEEYACPTCGELFSVDTRHADEPTPKWDVRLKV